MLPTRSMWRTFIGVFVVLLVERIEVLAQEDRPRAHAAPTGFNAIDVGGGEVKDFLKIPGGYRDGFQKVIFEEVGPTNVAASPDLPVNDRFGAYDDNSVVGDNAEIPLFIPLPYRNETAEEKAEREQKENAEKQAKRGKLRPTTTVPKQPPFSPPRTIISNAASNSQQITIRPTIAPLPQRPQRPNFNQPPSTPQRPNFNQPPSIPQRPNFNQPPSTPQQPNFNQRPFVAPQQPPPEIFNPPQNLPQSPTNSFQTPFNPQQTRPPFNPQQTRPPFNPQQNRPSPQTFIQPQRPSGFTLQPPKQPPQFNTAPQTSFRPSAPTTQQTPSTQFRTSQAPASRPLPQFASIPPRQPIEQPTPSTLSPFAQQQQNQFRQLRPFRPQNNFLPQQPTTSTTLTPVTKQGGLRTGVCSRTIYYKPQEASPTDLRQAFSHFAVVVSVDQCARTAHEFNSAQAIFDPTNRHCQFNPGTTFSNTQPCEQWPNPIYRNNLPITARPIIIRCVTCQARRRTPLRPFQRQNKALGISQAQFGPINRSTLARKIHGIIISENMQSPPNTDRILNKALEAERIVQFQPSHTATNIEHLEPMKSSSAGSQEFNKKSTEKPLEHQEPSNIDSTQQATKNEDKATEQISDDKPNLNEESLNEEKSRPFQRSSGIIVHKLHPLRLTQDSQ